MLNKPHNSIVTLAAVLLALVGVSKPAKAFLLSQADVSPTTFTIPDELPAKATVKMLTSNSTSSIDQSLKEAFINRFPQAQVNIETRSSDNALQALSEGKVDLVGIGRNLTTAERQQGLVAVPVSREKIAIVVSPDNPYDGNLTISQFARIFRGEITNWSEIGGQPGEIKLIDYPDTNDTRQAFPNYPVFQESEFATGSNAVKLDKDSTDEMIAQLGANGIGYAVANDVINRDDVKIVTMHQTQPDDERYPFSEPFYLVYQGTPNEATKAFIGFATEQGGEQVIANRVGSMSTAAGAAIASKLGNKPPNAPTGTANLPETTLDGEGNVVRPKNGNANADNNVAGVDANGNGNANNNVAGTDADTLAQADADLEGRGEPNAVGNANADNNVAGVNADGNGNANNNVAGTDADTLAQADADLEGRGENNPDLEGVGEVNPDQEGREVNPDLEGSAEPNAVTDADGEGAIAPNTNTDVDTDGAVATANKGKWWWWLPLILGIPILAAVAIAGFGGKKRSDREPAIGDPNIPPHGGGGISNIPDGDNLSAVGANTETTMGNAATNTSSQLGGAAVAGGAAAGGAAANFVAGRRTRENDLDDIRLDDSDDIESSIDIDEPVVDEIPSTPVTEFTSQETKLQTSDQSTRLQTDVSEDIDESYFDSTDGFNAGSAAAIGGAAASNLVGDRTDSLDEDIDNSTIDRRTNIVSEQTTKLQTTDLDSSFDTTIADGSTIEGDAAFETQTPKEFRGDFVLDEEATGDIFVDANPEVEEINLDSTDTASNKLNDINTNLSGFTNTTNDIQTPDVNTNINNPGSTNGRFNAGSAAVAGGAAAIGGAAASGFFSDREDSLDEDLDDSTINRQTDFVSEQTTKLQTTDLDSSFDTTIADGSAIEAENVETADFDTDIEEINLDNRDRVSSRFDDVDADISSFSSDTAANIQTPELDTDIEDTELDNSFELLDRELNTSSTTVEGAATSGFIGSSEPSQIDSDIEEIDLDSIETASDRFNDFETNVSDFNSDTAANIQTPELDTDIEDTKIDDTSGSIDNRLDSGSAAIGGAAASSFLSDRDRTEPLEVDSDIEEIGFNTDVSTTSGFNDNTIEDAKTTSEDFDISLDEITFDDADDSVNASLDEITFDDADDSVNASLDEITFDDADDSVNASLDEITFDDADDSADINLDDITFDDTKDNSLNQIDDSADINLDDITFDDTKDNSLNQINDSTDINLDDITFDDTEDNSFNQIDDSADINLDDTEDNLPNQTTNEMDVAGDDFDINLDDLGFDTSTNDVNADLLSGNAAKIADPSEDRSDDMNNISTWLDSLETPSQDSEDISGWLDRLNTQDNDSQNNNESDLENVESEDGTEDISFQFLEDLLEKDSEKNIDNP